MDGFKARVVSLQSELKAPKGQTNNFGGYKYRSCEDILEAVKPLLKKYGMVLTIGDDLLNFGNRYYICATATLRDTESGEEIKTSAYAREAAEKKGMDEAQITGAASSYARKYALNGLFCIDDTKDADAEECRCDRCGVVLTPYEDEKGRTVSIRKHAAGSEAKFGKVYCLNCIKELSAHKDAGDRE